MIRRLQTKEEIERKRKRQSRILSIMMLLILLTSTLGFAFFINPSSSEGDNINRPPNTGKKSNTDKISFEYLGNSFNLLSSYNNIENIPINITAISSSYTGKILYINANNSIILQELSSNLGKIASRVQQACYGQCTENLPEKNCSDNLIVFRQSQNRKIYQEENCIFIDGDIASADAFIYKLFNP